MSVKNDMLILFFKCIYITVCRLNVSMLWNNNLQACEELIMYVPPYKAKKLLPNLTIQLIKTFISEG
jgi:hypothetical protein